MNAVVIWTVFASIARALFSNSLVVREQAQDLLERPFVHAPGLDGHGTVSAPVESGAQFFDAACRDSYARYIEICLLTSMAALNLNEIFQSTQAAHGGDVQFVFHSVFQPIESVFEPPVRSPTHSFGFGGKIPFVGIKVGD